MLQGDRRGDSPLYGGCLPTAVSVRNSPRQSPRVQVKNRPKSLLRVAAEPRGREQVRVLGEGSNTGTCTNWLQAVNTIGIAPRDKGPLQALGVSALIEGGPGLGYNLPTLGGNPTTACRGKDHSGTGAAWGRPSL